MKINENFNIIYTVVYENTYYTSNNKQFLFSILPLELFEKLNEENIKDFINHEYYPFIDIYKICYGDNSHNVFQKELNIYKQEAKLKYQNKGYIETSELIYDKIKAKINTFNNELYARLVWIEAKSEECNYLGNQITILKSSVSSLNNSKNTLEQEVLKLENTKNELKSKIDKYKIEESILHDDMVKKRDLYNEYISKVALPKDASYVEELNNLVSNNITHKQKSDAIMYDKLMNEFDNKLSFRVLLEHKNEILNWL